MDRATRPLRWLEITADYRCNNRCLGCFAVADEGPSMSPPEIVAALRRGRNEGAEGLWLGGGEPTLRRDLLATVRAARALGYARVKLQTNGMLLGYEDFARRCAEAGVTEVAFSIKGHDAETHDRLARTPRCHALMREGMKHARALGMSLEGDVLVYRSNVHALEDTVRAYAADGVARFRLWLLAALDVNDAAVQAEVPRVTELARHASHTIEATRALSPASDFITVLHTPPCVMPEAHRAHLIRARDFALRVVNPGGHTFMLEDSGMEGGAYLPACDACALRARCDGPRRDYLRVHGGAEFVPVRAPPAIPFPREGSEKPP